MAVPKKKTSKSKRNMRRSHDALSRINVIIDKDTGEKFLIRKEHSFFFIKMEHWGTALIVISVLVYIIRSILIYG